MVTISADKSIYKRVVELIYPFITLCIWASVERAWRCLEITSGPLDNPAAYCARVTLPVLPDHACKSGREDVSFCRPRTAVAHDVAEEPEGFRPAPSQG